MQTDSERTSQKTEDNLAAVLDFYASETRKLSRAQRILEQIVRVNGQPVFLVMTMIFVVAWIGVNAWLEFMHRPAFDPLPYHLLHGFVSLGALVTATMVLIKQERLGRLAEQRDHLDLKVMLLTEQKAAKLIELVEELRRDLPDVRDRHDSGAAVLKESLSPDIVLATLEQPLSNVSGVVPDTSVAESNPPGAVKP
jgi:uncharacterized membrane protein